MPSKRKPIHRPAKPHLCEEAIDIFQEMKKLRCKCKYEKGVYDNFYPPEDRCRDCKRFKVLNSRFMVAMSPWFMAAGMAPWEVHLSLEEGGGLYAHGGFFHDADGDDKADAFLCEFEDALDERELLRAVKVE